MTDMSQPETVNEGKGDEVLATDAVLKPLTAEDVIAAENKGYDHGLRHGKEEMREEIETCRDQLAIRERIGNAAESERDQLRIQLAAYVKEATDNYTALCGERGRLETELGTEKLKRFDVESDLAQLRAKVADLQAAIVWSREATDQRCSRIAELEEQLALEAATELCSECNCLQHPSLVEGGVCIFCTLKESKAKVGKLQYAIAGLECMSRDNTETRTTLRNRIQAIREENK